MEKRDYLEDLGVDGRIILKWILSKSVGRARTELTWFRIGQVVGSTKCGESLD